MLTRAEQARFDTDELEFSELAATLNRRSAEGWAVFSLGDAGPGNKVRVVYVRDEEVRHVFQSYNDGPGCALCHYVEDAPHHVRGDGLTM